MLQAEIKKFVQACKTKKKNQVAQTEEGGQNVEEIKEVEIVEPEVGGEGQEEKIELEEASPEEPIQLDDKGVQTDSQPSSDSKSHHDQALDDPGIFNRIYPLSNSDGDDF